jgi:hypothetical protein
VGPGSVEESLADLDSSDFSIPSFTVVTGSTA